MAITSIGYERAISYANLGKIVDHAGTEYSVFDVGSFEVTAGVGDRAVSVAAGTASGRAILDLSDAPVTLNGAVVSSGSRWDMVVLRRNWSTKATTVALVTGTSAKNLSARTNVTSGVLDDQPIALVRFAAGQTAVQEIVDLRVWHGNGGVVANDLLAREYMNRIGTALRVGSVTWHRALQGSVAVWTDFTLDYSKLTGTPELPASAIVSGVLGVGRIPHMGSGTGSAYIGSDAASPGGSASTWARVRRGAPTDMFAVAIDGAIKLRFDETGTMQVGSIPPARLQMPVPISLGGTGGSTRNAALSNLDIFATEFGQFTLAAGASRDFTWDLPAAAAGWVVTPTVSHIDMKYGWSRSGSIVTITVRNPESGSRTFTVGAIAIPKSA